MLGHRDRTGVDALVLGPGGHFKRIIKIQSFFPGVYSFRLRTYIRTISDSQESQHRFMTQRSFKTKD